MKSHYAHSKPCFGHLLCIETHTGSVKRPKGGSKESFSPLPHAGRRMQTYLKFVK